MKATKKIWIVKMEAAVEASSATEAMLNAVKGAKAPLTIKEVKPSK